MNWHLPENHTKLFVKHEFKNGCYGHPFAWPLGEPTGMFNHRELILVLYGLIYNISEYL